MFSENAGTQISLLLNIILWRLKVSSLLKPNHIGVLWRRDLELRKIYYVALVGWYGHHWKNGRDSEYTCTLSNITKLLDLSLPDTSLISGFFLLYELLSSLCLNKIKFCPAIHVTRAKDSCWWIESNHSG